MLARLSIRDIVLIDQLELDFARGLTILTGETGAGKSILLDALSLALGARGDGGLVRAGVGQGQVTAVFEPPAGHPVHALLAAQDLAIEGELILRRVQMADGRTRAYVNDQSVGAQTLRALAAGLVEIHGQHDERALLDAATHRALVDAYGGLAPEVERTRASHAALRACERDLREARADVAAREKEADFAQHASQELTKLAVEPGEEDRLATRRQAMMQGEKVAADIADALKSLSGDSAILPMLASISRRLQRRAAQAPEIIEPSVQALDEAMQALEIASQSVEAAMRACDFDPRELENCEERLFALRGMARKYGVAVDALPALAQKYAGELADLGDGRARVTRLEREFAAAGAAYAEAARALSAARVKAAAALSEAVNAELPPLKLERARFTAEVAVEPEAISPDGYDRVEFVVQTNPGSRPGPLMKVASGGELARFLLALKVTLAERETAPTLVFDEIDTGVGGAVADAIGQRLARLSGRAQVLAVTHAPQVAARATRHLRIAKGAAAAKGGETRVATSVTPLAAGERREEIARMLAGATITDEARAAAARLLAGAG
ncbi:MAG: DNA repair protein RecN [Pseudomonadota bacterium]|nr:DNA repair protein RecN [Pseudomonadota bacterium]